MYLSCKLDGVSGLIYHRGISEPKLYTRGNGKVGQDISLFNTIFTVYPRQKVLLLRGEFIIPKASIFRKIQDNDICKSSSNMVAGLINHKTINDAVVDVTFCSL